MSDTYVHRSPSSEVPPRIQPMAIDSPLTGFRTLLHKEVLRFFKVGFQTVGAPVLNALLFLLIFSHVLDRHVTVYGDVAYTRFLVPGLVMMAVLQNAFANSSSSLIQSKITGNIIFVLLPPLSYQEFYAAYVLAATLRGLFVGTGVLLVSMPFVELSIASPLWVLAFAVMGGGIMGSFGVIAGIWADKFDQLRIPELSHHAADNAVRRLLFDSFAAAAVAGRVVFQPVLFHDRRVSLWFLWSIGCFALAVAGRGVRLFRVSRSVDPRHACAGL